MKLNKFVITLIVLCLGGILPALAKNNDIVVLNKVLQVSVETTTEGLNKIDLILANGSVTLSKNAEGNPVYSGDGQYVNLTLISATPSLGTGMYKVSAVDVEKPVFTAGTFVKGYEYLFFGMIPIPAFSCLFTVSGGNVTPEEYLSSGEVNVEKNGQVYTILYNGKQPLRFCGELN